VTSRADVVAAVSHAFPAEAATRILALLESYGIEPCEREKERVQVAMVALSQGDEAKLRDFLTAAKRDYRDVLMWAESPREARLDTPEKRRQLGEMLVKFGVDVPDALKD